MKYEILLIFVIITFGIIFVAFDMGSGGFLTTFLGAFGLIIIFIIAAMIFMHKKRSKDD